MVGRSGAEQARTRDLSPFLIRVHSAVQPWIGLIRLGNGQHAVWMHSALPRLGFIPWDVEQAAGRGIRGKQPRNGSLIQVQRAWRELAQKAIQNDQESVWDVDSSLKGPPAAHGWY